MPCFLSFFLHLFLVAGDYNGLANGTTKHGSSNAHATTAHYHQKRIRVGGMRRQPLKSAALFAYGQLTGVWGDSLSQSHPTVNKHLYTITVSTLFSLLMRASAKAQVTLVTKLKGGSPGCKFTDCGFTEAKPLVMKPKCCFTSAPEGGPALAAEFFRDPPGEPKCKENAP